MCVQSRLITAWHVALSLVTGKGVRVLKRFRIEKVSMALLHILASEREESKRRWSIILAIVKDAVPLFGDPLQCEPFSTAITNLLSFGNMKPIDCLFPFALKSQRCPNC
jgi:hypothetical protein